MCACVCNPYPSPCLTNQCIYVYICKQHTCRYNIGSECLGAGVRLGGHEVGGHQYGVGNSVYGNDFTAVGQGALKVLVSSQGDICGNTCEDGSCSLIG